MRERQVRVGRSAPKAWGKEETEGRCDSDTLDSCEAGDRFGRSFRTGQSERVNDCRFVAPLKVALWKKTRDGRWERVSLCV